MRKIAYITGNYSSGKWFRPVWPDFSALKAAGYWGVYITVADAGHDNPFFPELYDAARAVDLAVGLCLTIRDGGLSYGKQMIDLANKQGGRKLGLPPAVILDGSAGSGSHQLRGDFMLYFEQALLAKFPVVVIGLNRSSKRFLLAADPAFPQDDLVAVANVLKRAWLWYFCPTIDAPTNIAPWDKPKIWGKGEQDNQLEFDTPPVVVPPVVVPPSLTRTLLCDVSSYQDAKETAYKPDLSRMKDVGIQGVILRCSENKYMDSVFEHYWQECQEHKIPAMVYGFLDYWQPDPAGQGTFLANWFKTRNIKGVRAFLDFERPNEKFPPLPPREQCIDQMRKWLAAVDEGMGTESGIYMNLSTIQYLSPLPVDILKRPFWLAWPPYVPAGRNATEYTREMSPAAVPFTNLKVWQFSWTGAGIPAGFESIGIDIDWFLGGLDELNAFVGTPQMPVPEPSDSEKLKRLWDAHPELH